MPTVSLFTKKQMQGHALPSRGGRGARLRAVFGLLIGVTVTAPLPSSMAMEVVRTAVKERGAGSLFQIHRGDKWGYMDRRGDVVISPQFDDERDFFDGLAAVRKGARWGFINDSGATVIQYEFDDAENFSEGLAAVRSGRRWGFIDPAGHFKVIPQFEAAARFSGGLARFEVWDAIHCDSISPNGGAALYTKDDAPSYAFRDHSVPRHTTGGCFPNEARYGFVDKFGRIAIEPRFIDAHDFSEGFAAVRIGSAAIWGYADQRGRIAIEARFLQALPFSEGLAAVEVPDSRQGTSQSAGKWGFIRPDGRFGIAPQFGDARSFSEGRAEVETRDDLWGYIDKGGALAVAAHFVRTTRFSEGLALVWPEGDTQGYYIDQDGRKALAFSLWPQWEFSDGLTVAGQQGERKYVDRAGKIVASYEGP